MALAVAHGEQRISKVEIGVEAPSAEFAVRPGRLEGHRQEEYRRDVPKSKQAPVLAHLPADLQSGPSAIDRAATKIKIAIGIEAALGTKQASETAPALPPG